MKKNIILFTFLLTSTIWSSLCLATDFSLCREFNDAVLNQHIEAIEEIYLHKIDNFDDFLNECRSVPQWINPLLLAVKDDKTESLIYLLENTKIDVNQTFNFGATALTISASNQNVYYVRKLLEHGADPNIKTKHGMTALDFAKQNTQNQDVKEIIQILLQYGAE